MTGGHTLVIPTYNRPAFLQRLVRYYRKRAPYINLSRRTASTCQAH